MFGTQEWEKAATAWWDATLRDPKTLGSLGEALNGMCEAKERSDRMVERVWAHWRLPTASDVERIHERLTDLERQLGRVEELLEEALVSPRRAASAPAAPAAAAAGKKGAS